MKVQEDRWITVSDSLGRTPLSDSEGQIRLLTLRGPLVASGGAALWNDLARDMAWVASTIGSAPDWVSACAGESEEGGTIDALDVTLGFPDERLAQIQLHRGLRRRATAHTLRGQLALLQDEGVEKRARVHGSWVASGIAAAKRSLSDAGEPTHLQLHGERSLEAPRLMA